MRIGTNLGTFVRGLAAAASFAGCGGDTTVNNYYGKDGGNSNEPTYPGMCETYRDHYLQDLLKHDGSSLMRFYQECLDTCQPRVLDQRYCASVYCSVEVSTPVTDRDDIDWKAYSACMDSFGVPLDQ